jgi:hypothetical protein
VSRNIPVRIAEGGNLVTQPAVSLENVSPADFTRLVNWRRSTDQLIRQEGWIKFKPDAAGSDNQSIFDGAETLLRLAECVRPNGERVIVGASRTQIKRFNPDTFAWDVIGSGFSADGKRWQANVINGYLLLNNAVDLPQVFRVEWDAVVPNYEMREVGIARCGRITEFNGFLFLGDVTEIQTDQLDKWMNGYSTYVAGGTQAKAADFAVLLADDNDQFDVTTGASDVTATLPTGPVAPSTFWIWVKKVDAGVGRVLVPQAVNQSVVLEDINDIALIWSDGNAYHAKVFESGVIPADDPYGTPPSDILNRFPYEVAWSEFGEPTRWAPRFSVYMTAASTTLELPFETEAFVANETYVAVIGGGARGGPLGGDSANPTGILVTAVAGKTITLAVTTNVSLTYPRTVQVTRFRDVSTLVGKSLLQGDASEIIGMLPLGTQLIIYRERGIYIGRYVGTVDKPFAFRPKIEVCNNVPINGDVIIPVNGDFHIYPGRGGRFFSFDGQSYPDFYRLCDNARNLFFDGLTVEDEPFAVDNPITKQIWFCRPDTTMCLDYENKKVSEMDSVIDAAVYARRPAADDNWFVLGIAGSVFTYGLTSEAVVPILTWLRDGVVAEPLMVSGLIHFGDQMNEKLISNYTPTLSSPSPDVEMEVQLRSTHNPSAALADLLTPVESLPSPVGDNFITLAFQAIYFQDEILVTDERDVDVRISARFFEVELIKAAGITRSTV